MYEHESARCDPTGFSSQISCEVTVAFEWRINDPGVLTTGHLASHVTELLVRQNLAFRGR